MGRVLVVDDEAAIRDMIQYALEKADMRVQSAANAHEALLSINDSRPDIILMDVVMPGKNGLELLKMVKKEWPLTKAIMMTAYASTDTAMKAIRLGALGRAEQVPPIRADREGQAVGADGRGVRCGTGLHGDGPDGLPLLIGDLNAHRVLTGDRSHDTDTGHSQGDGQVIG